MELLIRVCSTSFTRLARCPAPIRCARIKNGNHQHSMLRHASVAAASPASAAAAADATDKNATRVAVITGCSSGIGMETADLFSNLGWEVHNISRKPCPVEGIINHAADLTSPSEATRVGNIIADHLSKRGGGTVTLVHNAAMHGDDSADHRFNAELMQKSFALTVVSPGLLTARILPWMKAGSSVLFVGSTLSEKAVRGRASYVTTKHAVIGLMRSYTQDLFGSGVHTAVICPGFTDTPMLQQAMAQSPGSDRFIKDFVSLGRLISPSEIAELIRFAAEHPMVNGSVMHANGGQRES